MAAKFENSIVLFRNDLRVHDNEALSRAVKESKHVLPIYCFDPRHFGKSRIAKMPRSSLHRTVFHIESVADLKENIKKLGGDLVIRKGEPETIIPELVDKYHINAVYFQEEATSEETDVEKALHRSLAAKNVSVIGIWGLTLFHRQDLPYAIDRLPDVFTAFRKQVESKGNVREEYPTPKTINLPQNIKDADATTQNSVFGEAPSLAELNCHDDPKKYPHTHRFKGGESAALARLKYYFWETNFVARYKETRNGLLGDDYSTKFSVYLWNGCLSPRRIYHEIKKYESQKTANESTYWVIFELLWRDYFKFVALKYGDRIFYLHGLGKNYTKQEWKKDDAKFQAWCEGKTGYPFVDANMRELNATGFMSNRGRQNVASFLAKDLGIDWRLGAEYFEAMLIDHDPASNWGNWQYQSGVGLDPQAARYFNIMKQANDYDPKAEYTLHWVPELLVLKEQGFKPNDIQQPWNLHLGSKLHYPDRIVAVTYAFPANKTHRDPTTKDIGSFFAKGGRKSEKSGNRENHGPLRAGGNKRGRGSN